tara:strand:- start:5 stop:2458 length:2454 start_codon:yes stop_codon:yes gene_type:complete
VNDMEIELSPEQINNIAAAKGLERAGIIARYIAAYKQQLEMKANKLEGADQNAALDAIPEQIKNARTKVRGLITSDREAAKTPSGARDFIAREAEVSHLKPLVAMNLYNNGKKIDTKMLNIEIQGNIDIRNPLPDNLKNPLVLAAYEGKASEGFKRNYEKIKETLDDKLNTSEFVTLKNKFPANKFLGAIDVSKNTERIKVYNFWNEVGGKYEQFNDDLVDFFLAIERSDLPDDIKANFDKLYNNAINSQNLEYIAKFENANIEALKARHRFFNIIAHRLALEKLSDPHSNEQNFKEEISHGDINAETNAQIQESFGNSSTMGDTIDMSQIVDDIEWDDDYDATMGAADPLLVYESNRGGKLLSITKAMENDLKELLDGIEEAIEDENGISLDTATDIENFFEEMADTTTLEINDLEGSMALPISVMTNVEFAKMYQETSFESFSQGEKIDSDNIDAIKDFFNDLHDLLSSSAFMAEVANRSTKGRRRGGKPDKVEARRMGFTTGSSEMPSGFQNKGELRGSLKKVQSELHKMLSSAIDYYFDPVYAGLMPIQIPNFASSIGSKVMQTFALDLGLETSMSKSYDDLFRLSAEKIDVGDLREVADFLENVFVPSVKIDSTIITEAENAADALTRMFGKKQANNNYCAALIHHYMEDTGDRSREIKKFNNLGKTIKQRAEQFHEMWTSRKAFPVFAMPHWLDMNQGILTKKSPASKTQYNRLKGIFENVQTDLPVLLHKLLKAHDAVRAELGREVIHGYLPLNDYGINRMMTKMQVNENVDMSYLELDQIIKAVDSHDNISKEYGISGEQVYMIKAHFR